MEIIEVVFTHSRQHNGENWGGFTHNRQDNGDNWGGIHTQQTR